ncbi:MAG: SPFH domain-containing protein [Acetobacteraceae bacterium]
MFGTVAIIWIIILILVVITLYAGVKTVPQGQVWTVERFGAYTRLLEPGLQFVLPFIDQIGRKLNVQEQVVEIPEQSVITRDNASVAVDGIIYFRVMEPEKAAYQVQNLELALTTLAMTNIRSVIGEMELDGTLSSRERINSSLLMILDGATLPWGVKVNRVEIRKIEPPQNLIHAMNLQMTAERERRAVVARADGEREAAIKRAEGEKQALILSAEGRQLAAVRDAEARIALSSAEAEATRFVSEAAAAYGVEGLRYFVANSYVKAFEALASAPNSRLVIVPMEAAGIAGGIAQALELLRGTAPSGTGPGGGGASPGTPRPRPQPPAPPAAPVAAAPGTSSIASTPAGFVPQPPAPPPPGSGPWGSAAPNA